MKKTLFWLCGFWVLSLGGVFAAGTLDPALKLAPEQKQKVLLQLQSNLKNYRTLQAKFTQTKHLALFQDELVSQGVFAFAAPDRLRWEITAPFHSVLILNGREVVKYDFPDGAAPRKAKLPAADALSGVLSQIADIHQGKFGAEEKNYDMDIFKGDTVTLVLSPKDPKLRGMIARIEIGFSASLDRVVSVVIREAGDDFTRIDFEDGPRNPALPDSLFLNP